MLEEVIQFSLRVGGVLLDGSVDLTVRSLG